MRSSSLLVVLALVAVACGKEESTEQSPYMTGFTPTAAKDGFTRYVSPVIHDIKPGDDLMWCQYLSAPLDKDMDVLELEGQQSKYGHHIVLYATTLALPGGTSRVCTTGDMLNVTFLGGTGGDAAGGSVAQFPPNVVIRIPKGSVIMANTHFVNTSTQTIDGQGLVDMKLADPTPERIAAGMFVNVNTAFDLAPTTSTPSFDTDCVVQEDLQFFLWTNHMHEKGVSAYSEVTRASDNSVEMIKQDAVWRREEVFSPEWKSWDANNLFTLHKGDHIRTHCEWENTGSGNIAYPNEMCLSLGFFIPGGKQTVCQNGSWMN